MAAPAALALAGHIGAAVAHFVFVFHGNAFAAPVFAGGAALPVVPLGRADHALGHPAAFGLPPERGGLPALASGRLAAPQQAAPRRSRARTLFACTGLQYVGRRLKQPHSAEPSIPYSLARGRSNAGVHKMQAPPRRLPAPPQCLLRFWAQVLFGASDVLQSERVYRGTPNSKSSTWHSQVRRHEKRAPQHRGVEDA